MDIKETIDKIYKQLPTKESIYFDIEYSSDNNNDKLSIYDNKMGGLPYFPKNLEYPKDTNGNPMLLLVQFNFNTFDNIKDFPNIGILQVFIGLNDMYGYNYDNPTKQSDFRVYYHKNIENPMTKEELIKIIPTIENFDLPNMDIYKLIPNTKTNMPITPHDYRFDDYFLDIYGNIVNNTIKSKYDVDDNIINELYHRVPRGIWLGGYPVFAQYDIREKSIYTKYDTSLITFDSVVNKQYNIEIMWGDCGTGTFFINNNDLKNQDFSNILYNFDCC